MTNTPYDFRTFPLHGDAKALWTSLEETLATIDSWDLGKWDTISKPFREWENESPEEFAKRHNHKQGFPLR